MKKRKRILFCKNFLSVLFGGNSDVAFLISSLIGVCGEEVSLFLNKFKLNKKKIPWWEINKFRILLGKFIQFSLILLAEPGF